MRKKLKKQPVYFVDSSVSLELMFKQENHKSCESFFQRAEYKFRLVTSTFVMGEIIKVINWLEDLEVKHKHFSNKLEKEANILIKNPKEI